MRTSIWFVSLFLLAGIIACANQPTDPDGNDPTPTPTASGEPTATPTGTPVAQYDRMLPGPGEVGYDEDLERLAFAYDRQFHVFNAHPFGLSLDAHVTSPADRQMITDFLAQDAEMDFSAWASSIGNPMGVADVDDVVDIRGEHGDLGMFGGVAAAGDAYRYAVLRDQGADAAQVAVARQDLLDAIAAYHVAGTITGTPGTVARGIRRLDEVGTTPTTVPIPGSCPTPGTREDLWRVSGNGALAGEWMYRDNNSKDQLLGYVFALGAFWDAIAEDTTIDDAVRMTLQADARALATSLRTKVQIGLNQVDLIVRDWNDCITEHHDLNPRVVPVGGGNPIVLSETSANQNGWNAVAALGIIRTLYHITGDADLRTYYYDELVSTRDYPSLMISGNAPVSAMYMNGCIGANCFTTNFSNVNMAFVGAYGLLRYETDPDLRAAYRDMLQNHLWDSPKPTDGVEVQQAWFNILYTAFAPTGNDAVAVSNAVDQLHAWQEPPYFNTQVVENCDTGEIAAGSCVGIDGVTVITIDAVPQNGGAAKATLPLPRSIRPPDNFEWRSDPRRLNGGGGGRLNPGGDFRAAYWFGRMLLVNEVDSDANVSPVARD